MLMHLLWYYLLVRQLWLDITENLSCGDQTSSTGGGKNCIYCYSTSLPAKKVILMKKRQTKGFQFGLQELLSVEEPPEPFSSSPVIPCNCDKNQMIMEIVFKKFFSFICHSISKSLHSPVLKMCDIAFVCRLVSYPLSFY